MGRVKNYSAISRRRQDAEKRQEIRDKRTNDEQIAKLDRENFSAKKERARLKEKENARSEDK